MAKKCKRTQIIREKINSCSLSKGPNKKLIVIYLERPLNSISEMYVFNKLLTNEIILMNFL